MPMMLMMKFRAAKTTTTCFVVMLLLLLLVFPSALALLHAAPSPLTRRSRHQHQRTRNIGGAGAIRSNRYVTPLNAKKKKNTATASSSQVHQQQSGVTSRQNRVAALEEWAQQVAQIQVSPLLKLRQTTVEAGLGWFAARALDGNALVVTVPSKVALTVECPGSGPDDPGVAALLVDGGSGSGGTTTQPQQLSDFPWFVQMGLYLYKLDRVRDTKQGGGAISSYRPWLDSLPRHFNTPLHWSDDDNDDNDLAARLQYDYLVDAVRRQRRTWKRYHDQLVAQMTTTTTTLPWDGFVWGCECARSRAFSGTFTGDAFNPSVYAFTLLLVTLYVGAGLGTLEQAANGAGLVLCVSILKDFVLPKLFKKNRYVICPMIDMANHKSTEAKGEVSFEFFGNAYSLAVESKVDAGDELFISYGARSNDQLLQYYGFVEADNPHDVYILPPLRNWDIDALEEACGRKFAPGRLEKLDRAGLLGDDTATKSREKDGLEGEAANIGGGVVLTRSGGLDPAVMQALRALVSSEEEWQNAGQAIGNFVEEKSGGIDNERCALLVAQTAVEMELASKTTTITEDEDLLKRMESMRSLDASAEEKVAAQFRIEKKKLLLETIDKLKLQGKRL